MNHKLKRLFTFLMIPAFAIAVVGCGETKPKDEGSKKNTTEKEKKKSASHIHGGHGGHIYQIGDSKFWYEAFYDAARETANIHILKEDGKTPQLVPLEKVTYRFNDGEKSWDLKAVDAKDGKAYKFTLEDKALVNALVIGGGEMVLMDGDKEVKGTKAADPAH